MSNFFNETKETFSILRNRYNERRNEKSAQRLQELKRERVSVEGRARLIKLEKNEKIRINRAKASIGEGNRLRTDKIRAGIRSGLKELKKMRSQSKPNPAFSLKSRDVYGFSKPKEEPKKTEKSQTITIKIK